MLQVTGLGSLHHVAGEEPDRVDALVRDIVCGHDVALGGIVADGGFAFLTIGGLGWLVGGLRCALYGRCTGRCKEI